METNPQDGEEKKRALLYTPPKKLFVSDPSMIVMPTNFNVKKYTSTNKPRFRFDSLPHWIWCPLTIRNILAVMMIATGYERKY